MTNYVMKQKMQNALLEDLRLNDIYTKNKYSL